MHANTTRGISYVATIALLLAACAGHTAPRGALPGAHEAQRDARGGWIEVTYQEDGRRARVDGEFIGMRGGLIYVSTGDTLHEIVERDVHEARLTGYDSGWPLLGWWALAGTLSTASHGIALIISAPVWIIAGTISSASQSRVPVRAFPQRAWSELTPYARFPQGVPDGFDTGWIKKPAPGA